MFPRDRTVARGRGVARAVPRVARRAAGQGALASIALASLTPAARAQGAEHFATMPRAVSAPPVHRAARRSGSALDSLLQIAEITSPALRAARAHVAAARARVAAAGARPDPTLMVGVVNLPIARPSLRADEMTMRMVGVGQTIPYPGKLGLQRRAAESVAAAAEAAAAAARLDVARAVREAYYELAYVDRALEIVENTRDALGGVVQGAEARYAAGSAGQQDVLTARIEATRVAETASALLEQRRAALAQLNAVLDRRSDTPVDHPAIPERLARAAVAADPGRVRFAAATLGARAADSPLPSLATLQAMAVARSPMLRQHEAMIGAQAARVELARKASRPDLDVSLQYGQRQGRPDMVTAQVSVPLPLQRAVKQDAEAAGAQADLATLEAEHHAQVNAIRAEVARLVSDAERSRTQLALSVLAVLPQARAAITAALASYRTGRADLTTVLNAQSTLFTYETTDARALTDFAKAVAALEQVVGSDILRDIQP